MKPIIFAVLFFMLIVMVSSMSCQDEIEVERVYVENVCAGAWPDYRNLKPDCEAAYDRGRKRSQTL